MNPKIPILDDNRVNDSKAISPLGAPTLLLPGAVVLLVGLLVGSVCYLLAGGLYLAPQMFQNLLLPPLLRSFQCGRFQGLQRTLGKLFETFNLRCYADLQENVLQQG